MQVINGGLSRRMEKAIAAVARRENEIDRAYSAATDQTGKSRRSEKSSRWNIRWKVKIEICE